MEARSLETRGFDHNEVTVGVAPVKSRGRDLHVTLATLVAQLKEVSFHPLNIGAEICTLVMVAFLAMLAL